MRKQILAFCQHYKKEVQALDLPEKYPDVGVVFFPGRCGLAPASWPEFKEALTANLDYEDLQVVSGHCIADIPPANKKIFQHYNHEIHHCLQMVVNPGLLNFYAGRGYYPVTPGWLENWQEIVSQWGFAPGTARLFFKDTARAVLLLDTGVYSTAEANLAEFAEFAGLPHESIQVGLDYLELLVQNTIFKQRLKRQSSRDDHQLKTKSQKDLSDFLMALDLLNSLVSVQREDEVIDRIKDIFFMLFGPREVIFSCNDPSVPENGNPAPEPARQEPVDGFTLPVYGSTGLVGSLAVKKLRLPEHLERYKSLASNIAGICGLAIENARRYQQVKELSDTDGLTKIANRRKLDEHIKNEWRRMQRVSKPLSLVMIDIDFFKNYNDLYGHVAGDECLKKVAQVLNDHCRRPGDLAGRYGGEEFTLVLPEIDEKEVFLICEKIRQAIADLRIEHAGTTTGKHLTASFGIAGAIPGRLSEPEKLLAAADAALFKAKHAGRNQVKKEDRFLT